MGGDGLVGLLSKTSKVSYGKGKDLTTVSSEKVHTVKRGYNNTCHSVLSFTTYEFFCPFIIFYNVSTMDKTIISYNIKNSKPKY
jgi:hypothetical protein